MTNWIDAEIWFAAFEPKPTHVATLQLEGKDNQDVLEPAFEFTQNIEEPWIKAHQDKLMRLMDCKGLRSMSVGGVAGWEERGLRRLSNCGKRFY